MEECSLECQGCSRTAVRGNASVVQRIPEGFVNTVVSQDRFKQWETEWTGLFTLFVIKTLKIDDSSENYMIKWCFIV